MCGSGGRMNDTNLKDLPQFLDKIPLHFSRNQFYRRKDGD
jgi:hypothetical protein